MIVTVTMNPAIDKTVEISKLLPGDLNRIQKVEYDAGGKGINVSKTIHELGGKSIAAGFLGGNAGKTIESVLKEHEITCDFVWVDGETRTNTKVFEENGNVTELNEPGVVPTEEQMARLMEKLLGYASKDTLFVLAGSVPKGSKNTIYGDMIRLLHEKGAKVLLDADGELLKNALPQGPDIIKPNRGELEEYAGLPHNASKQELFAAARELMKQGIETAAVSMGKEGALFIQGELQAQCPALSVKAHSTVGAGDAMVAALAHSWEKKLGYEETIRLCMAASAGAVTTIGTKPPSKDLVEQLKQQVTMDIIR